MKRINYHSYNMLDRGLWQFCFTNVHFIFGSFKSNLY